MRVLHDPPVRTAIRSRVQALTPDAPRRWGKMTVDQMLWHVNTAMEMAIGSKTFAPRKFPLPGAIMAFMVLELPWPKGSPTMPELNAVELGRRYDFGAERARCLELIDAMTSRKIEGTWPRHPGFGAFAGRQWSALHAKHLDYHLKQFSA